MNLHENPQLFKEAIRATANQMGIQEIFIEKDYWIVYVLFHIFHDEEIKTMAVFKGGTSLSKCFEIIDRFSEDIDITIIQDGTENSNQLNKKIRKISDKIQKTILTEESLPGITNKSGSIRKIAYSYPRVFQGEYRQAKDKIIVEASIFGNSKPNSKELINSYIYDMMCTKNQRELTKQYNLLPFEVSVLSPKRTFCEKIMGLVKSCYSDDPVETLKTKIRHCYDLYQILSISTYEVFFNSNEFEKILLTVGYDDIASQPDNKWLNYHPKEAVIYKDAENIWEKLESTYSYDFANLVIGKLPAPDAIEFTLKRIYLRLNQITWGLN